MGKAIGIKILSGALIFTTAGTLVLTKPENIIKEKQVVHTIKEKQLTQYIETIDTVDLYEEEEY